jgi:hypothetical protein
VCSEVFSLPLYPTLAVSAIQQVADALADGPHVAAGPPRDS